MESIAVRELKDLNLLMGLFCEDRSSAAYLIGALGEDFLEYGTWFAAVEGDTPKAVILLYEGLSIPALFSWGSAQHLALLLPQVRSRFPDRFLLDSLAPHRRIWTEHFPLTSGRRMNRLSLIHRRFRPKVARGIEVRKLGHADTAAILGLYTSHPDTFFQPYQLDTGLYFGVWESDRLASVAGVHIISHQARLGVVGNVMSAAWARGRGYARACVSTVCTELLDQVDFVVVDSPMENAGATHLLESVGFAKDFHFDRVVVRR